jgi:hypothetical protein
MMSDDEDNDDEELVKLKILNELPYVSHMNSK